MRDLIDNPKYFDFGWASPAKWRMANNSIATSEAMKEGDDDEGFLGTMIASAIGVQLAELVMKYNQEKGIIKF